MITHDLISTLIDRFQGSALGTFVGDAMGREVEGWSWGQIRVRYGVLNRVGEGIYTDDTEMMIGIMEALLEDPGFDPAIIAERFLANFHPFRGYGARIYGIMDQLRQGASWDQVGTDSWGNGGASASPPSDSSFMTSGSDYRRLSFVAPRSPTDIPRGWPAPWPRPWL